MPGKSDHHLTVRPPAVFWRTPRRGSVRRFMCLLALTAGAALMTGETQRRSLSRLDASDDARLDALMWAVEFEDEAALRRAAGARGVDLNARDDHGQTALTRAARNGWVAGCLLLLEHGADVNADSANGQTPLFHAVTTADVNSAEELVDQFIRRGADADAACKWDLTPLMEAARANRPRLVVRLIEAGANPARARDDGLTALHVAAYCDSPHAAAALLERGADPAARDAQGLTAAEAALRRNSPASVAVFREWARSRALGSRADP
jgi:ankyrin repeat protein